MLNLSVLAGAVAILLGVVMLVWPRRVWYVTQGWLSYDNPQDVRLSDIYLAWNALQAVALILFGIVILVQASR